MSTFDNCPECGVSFQGEPVPEEHRAAYGNITHFRRDLAIEVLGDYDGALIIECPDCKAQWPRFAQGDYRHERALKYIKQWAVEK